MGRLDDLKAAMNGSNGKMKHDLSAVDTSVLNKTSAPVAPKVAPAVNAQPVHIMSSEERYPLKPAPERPEPQPAQTENRNEVDSLYDFYIRIASTFGRLSLETLQQNELMVLQGLPDDDRKVSLESLMFIGNHFGDMIAALILNYKNIREVFANALGNELDLIKVSAEQRVAAHEKAGGYGFDDNDHPITLGVSRYTQAIELNIVGVMRDSMSVINNTELSKAINTAFETNYEQADADDVGALLSNPIFLLVLFNNNASFVYEVSQICDALRAEYKLS
jgi:hypothetical protein